MSAGDMTRRLLFMCCTVILFRMISTSSLGPKSLFSDFSIGKYEFNFKAIFNCNPTPNGAVIYDLYLNRKCNNATEIKGTMTSKIPIDDSFFMEFNLAMKDGEGNWIDNALTQKSPRACSSMKMLFGSMWIQLMKSFGFTNTNCPIPAGVHTMAGFDTSYFTESNLPKSFFYGTYKIRFFFSRKNEIFGCSVFIVEIKRPV